jgi:hypothetical protein
VGGGNVARLGRAIKGLVPDCGQKKERQVSLLCFVWLSIRILKLLNIVLQGFEQNVLATGDRILPCNLHPRDKIEQVSLLFVQFSKRFFV